MKKGTCEKPAGLLQPIPVGFYLLGTFPKTMQGNKYVITCTDYKTRWVEIRAVPTRTAPEVTQLLLENVTCRHSTPSKILTDGLLCQLDIQRTTKSEYRPQSNSAVETLHATLTSMMSQYVASSQWNWDVYLPLETFTCNISRQENTGLSPFVLLYERKLVLPSEVYFNEKIDEDSKGLWIKTESGPDFHPGSKERQTGGSTCNKIAAKMWLQLWMVSSAMAVVSLEAMTVGVVAGTNFQLLTKVMMSISSINITFQVLWSSILTLTQH
ncbi:hypothetical protein PR048_001838 [Dryococelus australis]|uniref:Integrase catalytic domain-containing protein n=1 Tax=Dryococelus australis TaxID=614101 RepID=A0ABQ9IIG0_9NEOP|nr:hypothetical protein PR048_001838 [Dryococelus australis]